MLGERKPASLNHLIKPSWSLSFFPFFCYWIEPFSASKPDKGFNINEFHRFSPAYWLMLSRWGMLLIATVTSLWVNRASFSGAAVHSHGCWTLTCRWPAATFTVWGPWKQHFLLVSKVWWINWCIIGFILVNLIFSIDLLHRRFLYYELFLFMCNCLFVLYCKLIL